MSKYNVNESEKNRIRNLHKNYSIIKEQDVNDTPFEIEDLGLPIADMDGAGKESGVKGKRPKPTGPSSSAPCPPQNSNSPYYTNFPEFCYEQIPGSGIYYHQQPGMSYHNHPDGHCCDNGPVSFRCHPVNGCVQINSSGGQFLTMQDCLNSGCQPQGNTEHCQCCDGQYPVSMQQMVPVGDCPTHNFGPQYSQCVSVTSPMPNCNPQGVTHYCIDCGQQIMTTYNTATAQGCPQGFFDLGTQVPSQGPCVDCANGPGSCAGAGWNGPYNSIQDCQQQCTPSQEHECVNNACVQQSGGQFPTLQDCQNSGCGQQTSYNCTDWTSPSGCQPAQGGGGTYPTLDDCLASPCQCDQHIANWPFYVNNPNYDPATPWSNFTDGPSNPNAIAQILNQVLNSNAIASGNISNIHYQKMKCREKALLQWQQVVSQGNCYTPNGTCNDPGFAVGPGDPLGCFAQVLVNNSNNANTQGFGCPWFCNALANKHNQLANTSSPVAICKHQGAIDFLTDYMTTGQSAYLNVPASFNAPCPNIPNGPGQNNIC